MITVPVHLRARCPSAITIGIAEVPGFSLAFCKRSVDTSGKASLVQSGREGDRAFGVVFEVSNSELSALDRAEGAGSRYHRIDDFPVCLIGDGQVIQTVTYSASKREEGLRPYCWYLALVLAGACEHGLERDYIDRLRRIDFDVDSDMGRRTRKQAVEALAGAGYEDYRVLVSTLST